MSRKSRARQASNARSYAFERPKQHRGHSATTPSEPAEDRLAAAIEKRKLIREQGAVLLGYDSVAQMEEEQEAKLVEELRLPPTAGADRSLQYLVTQMLRERDGNHCYLCQRDMTGLKAVVEHIIPMSRGGSNEPSNVALSCADCNSRKGSLYVSLSVSSGAPCYHQPRT